jgi:ribosomal protein S18 acetylase RimI-like enzyme
MNPYHRSPRMNSRRSRPGKPSMILEPFSQKKHSAEEVAGLIYDTEQVYFSLAFGRDRTEALRKIGRLIQAGHNAFGHENITCAVREGRVIGIRIMQTPQSPGLKAEFFVVARATGHISAVRFLLAEWLLFAPRYLERNPEPEYHISNLSVIPAERGRGVARALLEAAIREVRSRGGGTIVLNVIAPNPAAVHLYEKAGFHTISLHRAWVPCQLLIVRTMVYEARHDAAIRAHSHHFDV